jgi:ribose 5-phosphate isomerase B
MNDERATVVVGSDHAGFEMKEFVKNYLSEKGYLYIDIGAPQEDPSDDYPVFAFKLAKTVSANKCKRGILMCGTGIGASIAANRIKGVRAALCTSPEMAKMARAHNDSNVLVIGGRTTEKETAGKIIDAWLNGKFEGGRHQKRISLLDTDHI